jgi:hypothetical protein
LLSYAVSNRELAVDAYQWSRNLCSFKRFNPLADCGGHEANASLRRSLDPNHPAYAAMSRFEGQVPGGVLKIIVDEHQFMNEFIELLKRR